MAMDVDIRAVDPPEKNLEGKSVYEQHPGAVLVQAWRQEKWRSPCSVLWEMAAPGSYSSGAPTLGCTHLECTSGALTLAPEELRP